MQVKITQLIPTQNECTFEIIKAIKANKLLEQKPIEVNNNNQIQDGHHRYWIALANNTSDIECTLVHTTDDRLQRKELQIVYVENMEDDEDAVKEFIEIIRAAGCPVSRSYEIKLDIQIKM